MATWTYRVLANNVLTNSTLIIAPERKMAGVLLYLALEGPTSRQKLAGLLWPEVDETKARNSLAQVLRRLRQATYPDIVTGDAVLQLHEDLQVDASSFKLLVFRGETAEALSIAGELLPNFEFDDCPEYSEWLLSEREEIKKLTAQALQTRIEVLEKENRYEEALKLADRLIAVDPMLEAPYRLAMRLHYLKGDRAAALKVYGRCTAVLARELGIEPVAETQALAKTIEQGQLKPTLRTETKLPVTLLRPPSLIGREAEWARMEEAWEAGRFIFVFGPPGVGKTRLATDFAASKGRTLHFTGRPGDKTIPYAAHARAFRHILAQRPNLELPPWVRRELTRILPELLGEGEAPPSLMSEADKGRFYDAQGEILRLGSEGVAAWVIDDLQYYDMPSMEAGNYIAAKFAPLGQPGGLPRFVDVCRTGEMDPIFEAMIRQAEVAGLATIIDLGPLRPEATEIFVESLRLKGLGPNELISLSSGLGRYAGGNPLFMLETLRHLFETNGLADKMPSKLPPPGKVASIIRQRLNHLSSTALRVAQAAAVLQSDFAIELIGEMLEVKPLELVGAWEELEAAGVFHGNRFHHDLIYETIHSGISSSVCMLLNRRAAETLMAGNAPAARIAKHWLEGGNQREAMLYLLKAGAQAEATFRLLEARDFYERAATIAESLEDATVAYEALTKELSLVVRDNTGELATQLLNRLKPVTHTAEQRAKVYALTAEHLSTQGKPSGAERAARAGLDSLEGLDRPTLKVSLLQRLATALWDLNCYDEALAALHDAMALLHPSRNAWEIAEVQLSISTVLNRAWRNKEALAYQLKAHATFCQLDDRYMTTIMLMHIGVSQESLGQYAEALATYSEADTRLRTIPGTARYQYNNHLNLGYLHYGLENYTEALRYLQEIDQMESALAHSRSIVARTSALVYQALGQWAQLEHEIQEALERPDQTDPWRSYAKIIWAAELARRHQYAEARALFQKAEKALAPETGGPPILLSYLWFARANSFSPEEGLHDIKRAKALIAERELSLLNAEAELRHAQVFLALGHAEEALRHIRLAYERHAEIPFFGQYAELPFSYYRILQWLEHEDALKHLEEAYAHIQAIAEHHVPEMYRESFLTQNPVNAAIIRAYQDATAREKPFRVG